MEYFLHADDFVEMFEHLIDEAIVARVDGMGSDEKGEDDTQEPHVQVVTPQEALCMIESLRGFVFAKDLSLNYVHQLDTFQTDVMRICMNQARLTDYGFAV